MADVRRFWFGALLGWRDLRHEPVAFGCQILALAAVITPLLVLYGVKSGVMQHLTDQLASNVRTLQVSVLQEAEYTAAWIADMATAPEVGFIQAHTRTLAASVEIVADRGGEMRERRASLLASGLRDPLLPNGAAPPDGGAIILSAALGKALAASVGTAVEIVVTRRHNDRSQTVFLPLTVTGLADPADWDAHGALVHLDTLVAIERWRDGNAVPERGWTDGRSDSPRSDGYPNVRIYAAGLDMVEPLVARLTDMGLDVRSRLADVKAVQGLDRSLTAIFLMIGVVATLGGAVAFGATLWANVVRKIPQISLIRLQGMERSAVAGFPVGQALAVAVFGIFLAAALSVGTCGAINRHFASGLGVGGSVCRLQPSHMGVAALVSLLISLAASSAAAVVTARIDPDKGLSNE